MTAVSSDAAHGLPGPRQVGDPVRCGLPRGFTIAFTIASAIVFYALATHGTFSPLYEQPQAGFSGRFFFAQAQSIVHGHLYVSPTQLPAECFLYHGRCFGYFGLTPSLLRIPFLPLLDDANRGFTPVYMTLALTLAVGSALGILSQALANVPRTRLMTFLGIALVISLGPASVLDLITRPGVFEEAIAWSVGVRAPGRVLLLALVEHASLVVDGAARGESRTEHQRAAHDAAARSGSGRRNRRPQHAPARRGRAGYGPC